MMMKLSSVLRPLMYLLDFERRFCVRSWDSDRASAEFPLVDSMLPDPDYSD